jgi:hypothetical protein
VISLTQTPATIERQPPPSDTGTLQANTQVPLRGSGATLAVLSVACGAGLLLQALVGYRGRVTGDPPALLFWLSLGLMYGTAVATMLSRRLTRNERALGVAIVAVAMQLTRVLLYPDMFVYHDELIHVRVLGDILASHHLFTPNSTLPITPHYPGLEVATASIASLTGLSAHTSGCVVLVLARLILTLGMFLIVERITASSRLAVAACLLYLANPQYLFFNAQFSYQTLALALCFGYVYLVAWLAGSRRAVAWPTLAAASAAIAFTHHLTSAALAGILVVWLGIALLVGRRPRYLIVATVCAVASILAWGYVGSDTIVPYLTGIAKHNLESVQELLRGHSDHVFFKDSAGDRTPVWERYASLTSVLLLMILLPQALWATGRRWRLIGFPAIVLCLIAAMYPVIPLGHLTNATSEVADRSSGFIFVGVSFLVSLWAFGQYRSSRWRHMDADCRGARFRFTAVVTAVALILFVGGTIVGSGPPWLRAPGHYRVSAENRSVDQLALTPARWLAENVSPDHRIYADRVDALLASAIGGQHSVTNLGDDIDNGDLSRLLLAPPAPSDLRTVRRAKIDLLLVDTRIADDLPRVGIYTDSGEYEGRGRIRPPAAVAVAKFDYVPRARRIYDNGAVRIYDLAGIR